MGRVRAAFFILAAYAMTLPLFALGGAGVITSILCGIIGTAQSVIGILALSLFMLGGAIYGASHFLPTGLDVKKSVASWSTTMMVGGVLGLILVVIAPSIVGLIAGIGTNITAHC